MDWFLYDNGLHHERVKTFHVKNHDDKMQVKTFTIIIMEVRNSRVTKSSYETELRIFGNFYRNSSLELLTRLRKILNFELITRWLNFYFSTFELL